MKLKKLVLSNYRGFKNFECHFDASINVLVGLNGSGKSSLLEAIVVAYGSFMDGFGTATDRKIHKEEIHLAKIGSDDEGFTMEYQLPVTVQAQVHSSEFTDFPLEWSRSLSASKSKTSEALQLTESAATLEKMVQDGSFPELPLICYYGTDRLWNSLASPNKKPKRAYKTSRLEGYSDWLKPLSSYKAFSEWVYTATMASYERGLENQEQISKGNNLVKGNIHQEHLNSLKETLDILLKPSGWSNIRYSATAGQLVATREGQGDVPVTMLSDGVRNMIGMVADIAYRAIRLNPHLGSSAVKQTEGIVLIDEVDMHLHPEWQQLVLQSLSEAFPNIQFIVTTHSPQVLTTIKKDHIIILGGEQAEQPIGNTFGETSNYVMKHVLGVDSRPPLPHSKMLKEYLILIESGQGQSEEAMKIRIELELLMGEGHSDLKMADRVIQRKELLG